MLRAATGNEARIRYESFEGLLADFRSQGWGAHDRARAPRRQRLRIRVPDGAHEPAAASRRSRPCFWCPSIETTYVSSSLVREVARFGGDVETMVHPAVAEALRLRFAQ